MAEGPPNKGAKEVAAVREALGAKAAAPVEVRN